MTIDATETSDGNYLVDLPISVNKNMVTKYYTSNGEEILVNTENNIATMQLTETEVADRKVQIQTDYDTKEVTVNGETKLFYKKELTNEIDETVNEEQNETTQQEETTENQDIQNVIVTGYMPLDAKLEVKEIDLATLTAVKLSNEKQTMKKAYEFSIYQIVEKKNADNETATEEIVNEEETTGSKTEENTKVEENTTTENIETERIEYNPSEYGEKITVKTKYEEANAIATVYILDKDNAITRIDSSTTENKTEDNTTNIESISFETEKSDETIKYIIATEKREEEANNQDNTTSDENINNSENTTTDNTTSDSASEITNEIKKLKMGSYRINTQHTSRYSNSKGKRTRRYFNRRLD